jgi:hypothetical protein
MGVIAGSGSAQPNRPRVKERHNKESNDEQKQAVIRKTEQISPGM